MTATKREEQALHQRCLNCQKITKVAPNTSYSIVAEAFCACDKQTQYDKLKEVLDSALRENEKLLIEREQTQSRAKVLVEALKEISKIGRNRKRKSLEARVADEALQSLEGE